MLRVLISCLLVICLATCSQPNSLRDSAGNEVLLSKLKGHWVIFDYWAKWCDSCKAESSKLNNFYTSNTNSNVLLYGVNYDGLRGKKLQMAIKAMQINYPVLQTDPASYFHFKQINTIPALIIINPQGKHVKTLFGPQSTVQLQQVLHKLQGQLE